MWHLVDRCRAAARCIAPGWIIWAGLALAGAVAMAAPDSAPEFVISQGDLLLGDDRSTPPPDSAAWQRVTLPDYWYVTRKGTNGYAWYRLRVDVPVQPRGRQAVYVERLRNVGAFFVNGVEVGQYGEFGTPNPGVRPQLFEFEPTLLHPGRNTLHVRLWKPPDWAGMLAPVHLGPQAAMQQLLDSGHFWKTTAPLCAIVVMLFAAFITLTLWVCRPRESIYGYVGLAALFRLPTAASGLWLIPPQVPERLVWFLQPVTLQTFCVLIFMFALRYGGWRLPRIERVAWAWILVFAALDAAVIIGYEEGSYVRSWEEVFDYVLGALTWVLPIVYSMVFVVAARKFRSTEALLLAVAFTAATALGLFDGYARPFGENSWFPFRLVPVYLIVTWALMRRFARTLDESESLNADLAARVEAKRLEIEANYRHLGELEKEQVLAAERARLMRDMHDGIGGQLISTLSLVEGGEASPDKVAAALRECIDDLRLAIDSLEPTDDDLVPLLGNLRYRVEPRLKARGIELDWRVQDVPKLTYMTPQNVLNVLRILQEAFTNVIKHAGASHVCVATRCEGSRVLIDIRDDGKGLDRGDGTPAGHGLANMHQRAHELGGELRLQATADGTTVTLGLPLTLAPTA
jgi:signal transduction histidine kinase